MYDPHTYISIYIYIHTYALTDGPDMIMYGIYDRIWMVSASLSADLALQEGVGSTSCSPPIPSWCCGLVVQGF